MGWFSSLFGRGFSVSIDGTPTITYREGARKMRIAGEIMADGYAIYAASIKHWENQPNEPVDETERQRIASNVQQYLAGKGKTVYLSS
jgi:hypothetical protein